MVSVPTTIACGNLSARHGSRERGRGKRTVPCLVPFAGGTRLGPLHPPPPLTHTPHSFEKYLKTEVGANVFSEDIRDGAPPQTRTRGQRPLRIHVRPAVPGQTKKANGIAHLVDSGSRWEAADGTEEREGVQLGSLSPPVGNSHQEAAPAQSVCVFLLRCNRDRDAVEPGVFF